MDIFFIIILSSFEQKAQVSVVLRPSVFWPICLSINIFQFDFYRTILANVYQIWHETSLSEELFNLFKYRTRPLSTGNNKERIKIWLTFKNQTAFNIHILYNFSDTR